MIRIASNTTWFRHSCDEDQHQYAHWNLSEHWKAISVLRCDAIVVNVALRDLFQICFAKKLLRRKKCVLIAVDVVLTAQRDSWSRVKTKLRRWLLREVDHFVLYFRDTSELQRIYQITPDKIAYIPFKVNHLDKVLAKVIKDDGFFLSCGHSNRDYETLIDAFKELPFNLQILSRLGSTAAMHGTTYVPATVPRNIHLISDDGSIESWIDTVSRATAVILPILPGKLSPSGLSAYLVAMALGKCVIITDGLATRGLIDGGEAVIIPSSDVNAMRAAVERVGNDAAFRSAVAEKGQTYALSLEDENRLARDIRHFLASSEEFMGKLQLGECPRLL